MACLRRYLAACKLKYSNAFILWRQKFGPNKLSKDLILSIVKNVKLIQMRNQLKINIHKDNFEDFD